MEYFKGTDYISDKLLCLILGTMISDTHVLYQFNNKAKNKMDGEDMYCTVCTVKDKSLPLLSQEKLSRMWDICLKTVINNLDARTHQCIRSTGLLKKAF